MLTDTFEVLRQGARTSRYLGGTPAAPSAGQREAAPDSVGELLRDHEDAVVAEEVVRGVRDAHVRARVRPRARGRRREADAEPPAHARPDVRRAADREQLQVRPGHPRGATADGDPR